MKSFFTLVGVVLIFGIKAQGYIHDESFTNEGFNAFKNKLITCVNNKDIKTLQSLFHEKVLTAPDAFDCSNGCTPQQVMDLYFKEKSPEYWRELDNIIRYGFSKSVDTINYSWFKEAKILETFTAPSYLKKLNKYDKIIVLANDLNCREKPSTNSRVLTQVSFGAFAFHAIPEIETPDLFEDEDQNQSRKWVIIYPKELGVQGCYVVSDYTSVAITKNLKVANLNGEWKIVAFYSGLGC